MDVKALILAAGQGSRMKSQKPKVMFEVLDKPMISCVYDNLKNAGVNRIVPIISPERTSVLEALPNDIEYVFQKETKGTGHAVMQAKKLLGNSDGITVIVAGDQPLINNDEISSLINYHQTNNCDMTMLTAILDRPTGYGRVIKNGFQVQKIVEQKDLEDDQFNIQEVNISTYCFDNKILFDLISEIDSNNAQNEYYITDLVEIFNSKNLRVGSVPISNNDFSIGVNDLQGLATANSIMKEYTNSKHMKNGVQIVDPSNTYIGMDVVIANDTAILPGCIITGNTVIESGCVINASQIKNSVIKSGSSVMSSYVYDSSIGENTTVGPYAHVRAESDIKDNCRIGNFVEVKKSTLDSGVKSAHLTYLGDCEIGSKTNIGCVVITVNYDGVNKYKTIIGKESFIGSNVNLVAPMKIGERVKVGAGSTVVANSIEDDSLVIARAKEVVKSGYYKKEKS